MTDVDVSRLNFIKGYEGIKNWGKVAHPAQLDSIQNYFHAAWNRSPQFESELHDFANDVGVPVQLDFGLPKTPKSAERKLWDRNSRNIGKIDMIGDYMRASITVPHDYYGIDNLKELIARLTTDEKTVAYKDQFWKPNDETGYRSFKALWDIDGVLAEVKLEYGGMSSAYELTEDLRGLERAIKISEDKFSSRCTSSRDRKSERDKHTSKFLTQAESAIKSIRELRKGIHEVYAEECGLNELLDPNLQEQEEKFDVRNMVKAIGNNPFGRRLRGLMARFEPATP